MCATSNEPLIRIQVHDWDDLGFYRIVREENVTKRELVELKKQARESARENLDWDVIDRQYQEASGSYTRFSHLLYYAELLDDKGEVCFAGVYMHGQAYTDEAFYQFAWRPQIGFVGAYHRNTLCS